MAQIHVIGRVTADLGLQYSQQGNPYVRFNIAENIGSGDRARTQYYQVWAWSDNAIRLTQSNVRKGSLLQITGSVELEVYTKQDGRTTDKRMKIMLNTWSFIHSSMGSRNVTPNKTAKEPQPHCIEGIDGDREALPE